MAVTRKGTTTQGNRTTQPNIVGLVGLLLQVNTLINDCIGYLAGSVPGNFGTHLGPVAREITFMNKGFTPAHATRRQPMSVATRRVLSLKAKQNWAQRRKIAA